MKKVLSFILIISLIGTICATTVSCNNLTSEKEESGQTENENATDAKEITETFDTESITESNTERNTERETKVEHSTHKHTETEPKAETETENAHLYTMYEYKKFLEDYESAADALITAYNLYTKNPSDTTAFYEYSNKLSLYIKISENTVSITEQFLNEISNGNSEFIEEYTEYANEISRISEKISELHKYQVTEEEWISALNFETPATKVSQYVYYPKASENKFIYYDVTEFGDNVIHSYETDETFTTIIHDYYYVKNGDVCDKYGKGINGWEKQPSSISTYEYQYDHISNLNDLFIFDAFVYDHKSQSYTCDEFVIDMDGEVFIYYNAVLKFKDKKLISYYMESEVDGYNAINTSIGYDAIEITLPSLSE